MAEPLPPPQEDFHFPFFIKVLGFVILVSVVGLFLVTNYAESRGIPSPLPALKVPGDSSSANSLVTSPSQSSAYFAVGLTPSAPIAGDDVTITAVLKEEFVTPDWKTKFWYEIWARQYGNWRIKSCYSSPCSMVYSNAALGNLEYVVKRRNTGGGVISEPASGAYSLVVGSNVPVGDTLPPRINFTIDPPAPRVGDTIDITVIADDISSVAWVEVYVNGTLRKTCPEVVKIASCRVTEPYASPGIISYYAISQDTMGNSVKTGTSNLNILPN